MKLRLLVGTVVVLAVTMFFTELIYAANGDLIVYGNLGVGTPTPAAKAQVNGNMIVNGTITNNGETVNGNASVTGNLGVGTTTPTQKLDVNGNVNISGYVNYQQRDCVDVKVSYYIARAKCGVGYYAAGIVGNFVNSTMVVTGITCCR